MVMLESGVPAAVVTLVSLFVFFGRYLFVMASFILIKVI